MRKSILIICGLILAVCIWLLFHRATKQISVTPPVIQTVSTNQPSGFRQQQKASDRPIEKKGPLPTQRNRPDFFRALGIDTNSKVPFVEQMWQKPIDFYGKVIDENSNAISGASIGFRWDDLTAPDWTRTATTTSDADGLFSLHNKRGATLTVSVSKDGYYSSRKDEDSFHYAVANDNRLYSSDPYNPAIFHLRKKGQGEELIQEDFPPGFTQIWQLHHDGTPVELDLLNGSQNVKGSGQLKLELWRDLSDRNAKKFDWKLQISVLDGGIIPTDEEFPFLAPENGYQPSLVVDMPATNQVWLGELRTKYYLQLPNGNYGRIDFHFLAYNGVFTVKSWVNPTGSRNLESK